MTHRSRICAVLIDTGAQSHEQVARFCVVPAQSAHWPEGAAEWP